MKGRSKGGRGREPGQGPLRARLMEAVLAQLALLAKRDPAMDKLRRSASAYAKCMG